MTINALTRIQNNQIYTKTIVGSDKIADGSLTSTLFNNNLLLNSNITITGNLAVYGNTSTVNSINTYINDPLVVFNNGYTGSLTGYDIGMIVNRNWSSLPGYGSVNTAWVWDESDQAFEAIATDTAGNAIVSLSKVGFANVRVGNLTANSLTLISGLNNTVIGNSTPNYGTFTYLTATQGFQSGNATITGAQTYIGTGDTLIANIYAGTGYFTNLNSGNAVITGAQTYIGTGDTLIANIYAGTGYFTNLNSGNAVITGAQTYIGTGGVLIANVYAGLGYYTNFSASNATIGTENVTTASVANFSSPNVKISGGYITGLQNVATIYDTVSNFYSGNVFINGGYINNLANITVDKSYVVEENATHGNVTTLYAANFNTPNAAITGSQTYIGTGGTLIANIYAGTEYVTNLSAANAVIDGTNTYIGTGGSLIANIYSGTGYFTNLSSGNAYISGAQTYIGASSANPIANISAGTGYFTNLSAGNAAITGATTYIGTGGTLIANAYITTGYDQNFSTANAHITGGYIDNMPIGANARQSGAFTTLTTNDITTITNGADAYATSYSGALQVTGGASFTGNVWVGGNLYVANLISTTTNQLVVSDPLVYFQNPSPEPYTFDIGFYSDFVGGPVNAYGHSGVVRQQSGNAWVFFSNIQTEPTATSFDWYDPGLIYDAIKAGNLVLANTVPSSSSSTGALIVKGGAGIGGQLYTGANINITGGGSLDTTMSTGYLFNANVTTLDIGSSASTINFGATSGTITIGNPTVVGTQSTQTLWDTTATTINAWGAATTINAGNTSGTTNWLGIYKIGGNIVAQSTTNSTSTTTGALVVAGGAGIAQSLIVGGNVVAGSSTSSTSTTTGALVVVGGAGIDGNIQLGGEVIFSTSNISINGSGVPTLNQSGNAIAIGSYAGASSQSTESIAIGSAAGSISQATEAVAIGSNAGQFNQKADAVAIGFSAGQTSQNTDAVAIGHLAGQTSQNSGAIAIGGIAGSMSQSTYATAIGWQSGASSQSAYAVAIGYNASYSTQGNSAVALGTQSGNVSQGADSIAIGTDAGLTSLPTNAIAIGKNASRNSSAASIVLNATGTEFNGNAAGFFVKPVRTNSTGYLPLVLDTTTNEITAASGNIVITAATATNNTTTGALVIPSGGAAISGNINIGSQLFVGSGAQTIGEPLLNNALTVIRGTSPSGPGAQFAQFALMNSTNTGSSDFRAYPNNYPGSTNDHGWVDMGITGDAYSDPLHTLTKKNDGYLFASGANSTVGGNLVISTDYSGNYNDVVIGVGSFFANSEVARFHGNTANNGTFTIKLPYNPAPAVNVAAVNIWGSESVSGNNYVGGAAIYNGSQGSGNDVIVRGAVDSTLLWARPGSASYDQVLIGGSATVSTLTPYVKLHINSNDSILLPKGDNSTRPGSQVGGTNVSGMFRYNTVSNAPEWYDGAQWQTPNNQYTVIQSQQFDNTTAYPNTVDGVNTVFTLSYAATTQGVIVSINGVVQIPTLAYGITGGTTLTFTEAPASGDYIDVRILTTAISVTQLASPNGYMGVLISNDGVYIQTGTAINGSQNANYWETSGGYVHALANVSANSANVDRVVDSFSAATYRSAKYVVQVTNGADYQVLEALLLQNGSTATINSYNVIQTNGNLGAMTANVSSGTTYVSFVPANGTTSNIRISKDYYLI